MTQREMIGALHGPWLLCAALLLLSVVVWRGPRPRRRELWLAVSIVVGAAAARLVWGLWGPLHVNGQGPLWIRGAFDPEPLAGYGPGYFEMFGWLAYLRTGIAPDQSLFAANGLLSALSPALLYAVARLAGVARGGALVAAVVLAADAVTVRMAASEGYVSSLALLVLAVQVALALALRAELCGDRISTLLALAAAGLAAAAAARIHPMAYLPLSLCPLVVLGAEQPGEWQSRALRAAAAAAVIGVIVLLTSASTIVNALGSSPMASHTFTNLAPRDVVLLLTLAAIAIGLQRWVKPAWLPLLGIFSLAMMLATQGSFQQHPFWKLCYQRLFWPGLLLGAAPLLSRRMQGSGWAFGSAAAIAAILLIPALPYFSMATTEQLEYRFLQKVLRDMPPGCAVASVSQAGNRIWEIPSYLVPSREHQAAVQRAVQSPADLNTAVGSADCLVYIHSSLCSSAEARALCESVEHGVRLEHVASSVFPAVPSYVDLPYDRSEVAVAVFRVNGREVPKSEQAAVGDGAAITPQFAQSLYDRLTQLRESDGCRMSRFDTSRFRITIGLRGRSGAEHALELATAPRGDTGRKAGGWALAVPPALERDCEATLAAIEGVLSETAAPRGTRQDAGPLSLQYTSYVLLAVSFVLLVLGTVRILYREVKIQRPPPYAILMLVLVWGAALALRLLLSPHTFLHEYYHIAETILADLVGRGAPIYGNTGPALFRLAGAVLGRPQDVEVIFQTNAVLSSLAIPAVALLDLALMRSWPRALCAAVLLCVLPQHLRFSAGEDLFVQSITFGLWALGLFVLYVRTRRLDDALCGALALSLAMQTRPEMLFFPLALVALVLLAEPRSWRVLFAWRTMAALLVLGTLLIPRLLELHGALQNAQSPTAALPNLPRYAAALVLFDEHVTPAVYWALLLLGLAWGAWRRPGVYVWLISVFIGYTLFSLSLYDNPPYNLRSQILPTSFVVLIAAGTASLWMELWGPRRRLALGLGAGALAGLGVAVVVARQGFITELRDQQLEWAFLDRSVPRLPDRATLLSAVDVGGMNLDAFPEFLLSRAGKTYEMVDVRRAASEQVRWPPPGDDLLYYQGMFCYFAVDDTSSPDPMTAPCKAVHDHYAVEPLLIEDLDTQGYSALRYAHGPFRIGFFKLKAGR